MCQHAIPFRLDNIPLYGGATFCFSVHPLMCSWVVFQLLTMVNNAAFGTSICLILCFSFLRVYTQVESQFIGQFQFWDSVSNF